MQTYRFTVQQALERGELCEVLSAFGGARRPFILLYPHARHVPQRVRAFIDFITRQ